AGTGTAGRCSRTGTETSTTRARRATPDRETNRPGSSRDLAGWRGWRRAGLASAPPLRHARSTGQMKTILVVEDEMKIARLVRDYLEHAGFDVIVAGTGEAAIASARSRRPDLVVLDLGLPGRDGLDVARELRRSSEVPIIMLTARGDET